MQSGRAKRRGKLMDKAILLAVAASVCTATASLCQQRPGPDHPGRSGKVKTLIPNGGRGLTAMPGRDGIQPGPQAVCLARRAWHASQGSSAL